MNGQIIGMANPFWDNSSLKKTTGIEMTSNRSKRNILRGIFGYSLSTAMNVLIFGRPMTNIFVIKEGLSTGGMMLASEFVSDYLLPNDRAQKEISGTRNARHTVIEPLITGAGNAAIMRYVANASTTSYPLWQTFGKAAAADIASEPAINLVKGVVGITNGTGGGLMDILF